MKKPYRKIARLVILSSISILVSMLISLILLFLCLFYWQIGEWLSGVLFFVIWLVLIGISYLLFKALIASENKKRGKYIVLETDINETCHIIERADALKVDGNTYLFVYNERMLNTISVFLFDEELDQQTIKIRRRKTQAYLKEHYPVAKEQNVRWRHHELNVQMYAVKENQLNEFKFNSNSSQLLTIGYIECVWNIEQGKIVIPSYTGKEMEISSLINYDKMLNKLIGLFNITKITEQDKFF